jgi:4-amino-4-deoxy-L-arabinose transferase-like glycosyltransferase
LLAVLPLSVRYSHYVLADTLQTFLVTLTFLLALAAHERNSVRAFAMAGAAAGLAAATKYSGGIAVIMPLLACWMTVAAPPSRRTRALATIAAAATAFLAAAPYTLLDLPGFLNGFARLAHEYRVAPAEAGTIAYLELLLRDAFQWPALLLAAGGLGLGIVRLVRGPGRVRWALAVVFPVLYFWMIRGQGLAYGQHLLPIVPPLCILAATAVVSGVSLLRRYEIPRAPRTALIAALTIAALLPPALVSVGWVRNAARTSTVDLAYAWILQHVPQQSIVAIESRALLLPASYRSKKVPQARQMDYGDWSDQKVDYLVASGDSYNNYLRSPEKYPREYSEYMRIFEQSRELVRFTPSAATPGPELRIFKVIP